MLKKSLEVLEQELSGDFLVIARLFILHLLCCFLFIGALLADQRVQVEQGAGLVEVLEGGEDL